jgi:hypothetical protein
MKKTFGKLMLLTDLFSDDESQLEEFVALDIVDGVTPDSDGTTDEFSCDEMEITENVMYNFIGGEGGCRFYASEVVVFKHKVTGEYWAIDCDELYEF